MSTSIIVFGSFAPGSKHFDLLPKFTGKRQQVWIRATPGPTAHDYILHRNDGPITEAWCLEICEDPTDRAETYSVAWRTNIWDIWGELDGIFGSEMARTTTRYFLNREDAETLKNIHVGNCYASIRLHPVVDNRYEERHPAVTTGEVLIEQVSGTRNYNPCDFYGMVNGLDPSQFDEYFGMLPNGDIFICRLRRLFKDHTVNDHPCDLGDGTSAAYLNPLQRNVVGQEKILELARQCLNAKNEAIKRVLGSDAGDDELIEGLTYSVVPDLDSLDIDDEIEVEFDDKLSGAIQFDAIKSVYFDDGMGIYLGGSTPLWSSTLEETCYSIAASYDLRNWLLQGWTIPYVNLDPLYEFWKAGGWLRFDDTNCYVAVKYRE